MANKVLGSYLYELKPYVDKKAWKKASGDIDESIKSSKISYDEWDKKRIAFENITEKAAKLKAMLDQVDIKLAKTSDEKTRSVLMKLRGATAVEEHERTGLLGDLQTLIEKGRITKTEYETYAPLVEMPSKLSKLSDGLSKFAGGITAAYGSVMSFVETEKKIINSGIELANKASNMANKLNAYGAYGSMSTRDMMARYGVSVVRANAMNISLAQLGLSESDIGRMSVRERKAYDSLIQHFEDGIARIDTDKLNEYYGITEKFQLSQSKWKIDIQNSILRLFAESNTFKNLTGSLEKFFDKSVQFLETPQVQWFFDVFIQFLSTLVDFASNFMGMFGISSNNISTINNKNNNSRNTYYIYGSDYSSNTELARSIALETDSGGIG